MHAGVSFNSSEGVKSWHCKLGSKCLNPISEVNNLFIVLETFVEPFLQFAKFYIPDFGRSGEEHGHKNASDVMLCSDGRHCPKYLNLRAPYSTSQSSKMSSPFLILRRTRIAAMITKITRITLARVIPTANPFFMHDLFRFWPCMKWEHSYIQFSCSPTDLKAPAMHIICGG